MGYPRDKLCILRISVPNVYEATKELDQLAGIQLSSQSGLSVPVKAPTEVFAFDIGRNIGLRIRLLVPIVKEGLAKVAPHVLKLLPTDLLKLLPVAAL